MSFRIWTIFYVLAVVGAALAIGALGIIAAFLVLGFWGFVYWPTKPASPDRRLLRALLGVLALLVLIVLFLPAINTAQATLRRVRCRANLTTVAISLLTYHAEHGAFPPAFVGDVTGKPMHSWRVLILPYIGEWALHQRYNFNEPWDGPNNSRLAAQIPDAYHCPSQVESGQPATETNYFAVVGPETAWPGSTGAKLSDVKDGTAKTIMLIEASGLGINWMEPRDVTLDEAIELLTTKPQSGHVHVHDRLLTTTYEETSQRNAAFCDGRVAWLFQLADTDIAKTLLTIDGGEALPSTVKSLSEWDEWYVDSATTTVIKWSKVWALSVFVVLAVLPAAWLKRRHNTEASTSGVRGDGERNGGTGEPSARG